MPLLLSQDYNEPIQNPAQCFADAELRQGQAETNDLGLRAPRSGNFADVYREVVIAMAFDPLTTATGFVLNKTGNQILDRLEESHGS
jgi:hypothetical protein